MKRYTQLGPCTMMEDHNGLWLRHDEVEPLVRKAVDNAKMSGLFAGSMIAEQNDDDKEDLLKACIKHNLFVYRCESCRRIYVVGAGETCRCEYCGSKEREEVTE